MNEHERLYRRVSDIVAREIERNGGQASVSLRGGEVVVEVLAESATILAQLEEGFGDTITVVTYRHPRDWFGYSPRTPA